jgi:protein AbiQ
MKFYHVDDAYVAYLKTFEPKVSDNKQQSRPYVGIIIEIDNVFFYAPLSSPKPKHKKMKNSIDFRKINGGIYGAININLMIPVPINLVYAIDFSQISDQKYKRLLQNQYKCIKSDWSNVVNAANKLYNMYIMNDSSLSGNEKKIKQRCCNFPLLIDKANNYIK